MGTRRGAGGSTLQLRHPHIQEDLHESSTAQAFLTDGGASSGAGGEGTNGKARWEGRIVERENSGETEMGHRGDQEMWSRER